MRINIAIQILILCLCMSCAKKSTDIQIQSLSEPYTPLKTKKVLLDSGYDRFFPVSIFAKRDSIIVIQKGISDIPCVNIFNLEGDKLASGCNVGKGPNEVVNIDFRFFTPSASGFQILDYNNKICDVEVNDQGGLRIVNRTQLNKPEPVNFLISLGEDRYCTLTETYSEHELCIFTDDKDVEGKYFGDYPLNYEYKDIIDTKIKCLAQGISNIEKKRFAYFYSYFVRFRIYSDTGRLLADIGIDGAWDTPIAENILDRKFYFSGLCATDEFIFTIYKNGEYSRNNASLEKNTKILQWDWDGNLIGQYITDCCLSSIAITSDHKLVGLNSMDDYPYLYIAEISK